MSATDATGLVVTGSAIFLVGAAIGVPRVFTEPDPERRLRLLEERLVLWRLAQPLYAIGTVVAAVGIGFLAADVETAPARSLLALACVLLTVGALCWSWSVQLRFRDVRGFAFGRLPGWPFAAYVWLTLAGLAALGAGLLASPLPAWTGWLTLAGGLAILAVYVGVRDIPPFVFYTLLPVVSLGWL